jgi:spore coat polysaccharide biosynthesis protein SpsF
VAQADLTSCGYDASVPLGILQARMTSSRLPGKVLEPILGEPLIGRQIERLRRASSLDGLVVATSVDPSDDELASYLDSIDVPVVRGSLDDVLIRFISVIDEYAPDAVVRRTADCPLTSPFVVDRVVGEFARTGADYVSNTLEPTWPDGVDVEVVRASALRWVAANSEDPHEHEHVTLGVYRRPERFRCLNVVGDAELSALRWTVDNADDLAFVREVYAELLPELPSFDVADVLALLERRPSLSRTSADAARNAALDGLDTGAMKHSPG